MSEEEQESKRGEHDTATVTVDISFHAKDEICLKMTLADLQNLCDMANTAVYKCQNLLSWVRIQKSLCKAMNTFEPINKR